MIKLEATIFFGVLFGSGLQFESRIELGLRAARTQHERFQALQQSRVPKLVGLRSSAAQETRFMQVSAGFGHRFAGVAFRSHGSICAVDIPAAASLHAPVEYRDTLVSHMVRDS
jgi:hypothetical protein